MPARAIEDALSGIDHPKGTPRALAAASAARVRSDMACASCSATAAMTCNRKRFASGISAAAISTSASGLNPTLGTLGFWRR